MTTRCTNLAAAPAASAQPAGWPSADSSDDRRGQWQRTLDIAWQRKIDQVVILSAASCGVTPDDDGSPAHGPWRVSSRLLARTERAYDELAAIEDAMARIEDGTYGACAGCDRAMSDEWLEDNPEARYCPDCSLRLVSWQRSGPPRRMRRRTAHNLPQSLAVSGIG